MPIRFSSKPGLVAYLTVGDPNLATTHNIAIAAIDAGADVLELGVPFFRIIYLWYYLCVENSTYKYTSSDLFFACQKSKKLSIWLKGQKKLQLLKVKLNQRLKIHQQLQKLY